MRGGQDDDWLDGGSGDDIYWGDKGADRFSISSGFDIAADFNYGAGDRVAIRKGLAYSLQTDDSGLRVVTSVGTIAR